MQSVILSITFICCHFSLLFFTHEILDSLPNSYLCTTLSFIWSRVSGNLVNLSPIFPFSSVFGLYRLPREISGSLAAKCSHDVHQQLSNCVCLLFGAEQVVYSDLLELFFWW